MIRYARVIAIGFVSGAIGLGAAHAMAGASAQQSGEAILAIGEDEYLHASSGQIRYCQVRRGFTSAYVECGDWE